MKEIMKLSLLVSLFTLVLFASCTKNEITSITLNKTTEVFNIAQTDSLIATIQVKGDINKFPITWTTSNSSVVTVVNGKIEGIGVGNAVITAKAGDLTSTCNVNVSDQIVPITNEGHLIYRGDKFDTSLSNYFDVYLFGARDTLVLSFNLPLAITDSLPVGSYSVISLSYLSDFKPNTSNPAFSADGISVWGSFFIGKTVNPVKSGSIVVSTINKNYAIEYNLVDFYGNNIYGTFLGNLTYHDETASSSMSPSAKRISIVKQTSLLNKIKPLKR
ncbi:MAG: hypothetical protein Q8904_09485 [Bacteroidota bacterium]|nr:hypothetical protein [Bacteroidota bacterium]